ncbi:MAG TPA: PaaI family thioesterase [Candidatus Limiplasma sp.]|nr:PaaI family thioesterase [Candidatus Limiplasma sp.]
MNLEELRILFEKDAFATELCGIRIDEVSSAGARCSMPLTPQHLNSNGTVQGGAIFTLCDTAFSVAANAGDRLTVSRSADITYIKPGTGACLYAVAEQIARGGTTCLYRVSVYDDRQTLIAYMTGNGHFLKRPQ